MSVMSVDADLNKHNLFSDIVIYVFLPNCFNSNAMLNLCVSKLDHSIPYRNTEHIFDYRVISGKKR